MIVNGFYGLYLSIISTIYWFTFRYDSNLSIMSSFWDWHQLSIILVIGVLSNFGNQLWIVACQLDKASRVASLNYLSVVLSYAGDIVLYGYSLGLMESIGALLIISCSSVIMVLKYLNKLD